MFLSDTQIYDRTVVLRELWSPQKPLTQNLLPNLVGGKILVPMWHSIQGAQPTGPKLGDRHKMYTNVSLHLLSLV